MNGAKCRSILGTQKFKQRACVCCLQVNTLITSLNSTKKIITKSYWPTIGLAKLMVKYIYIYIYKDLCIYIHNGNGLMETSGQ